MEWKIIEPTKQDQDYLAFRNEINRKILTVFSLPPDMLGLSTMDLYSIKQAARRLELAPRTIRHYVKIGRFKHIKTVKHASMEYYYLTEASFRAFGAEYERSGPGGVYYKRRGNV